MEPAGMDDEVQPGAEAAVVLEDVVKHYAMGEQSVPVLHGFSLEVPRGRFLAVMGPSGSGKSTLMNLIGCLDSPTAGRIWVNGQEVTRLHDAARTRVRREVVGFIFQSFHLMPRLTALENVALPLVFQGVRPAERRRRALAMLERVDLAHRAGFRPNRLSGGEQQRVAVARALVTGPALLLADEPTGNLDSATGERIMGLFGALHRAGFTVVMVTHDPQVARHAQVILHLVDGRVDRVQTVGPP